MLRSLFVKLSEIILKLRTEDFVSKWNKIILRLAILVMVFFSSQAMGQDRIELLRVAHEGLHYFLVSVLVSPGFTKNLKPEQKAFFDELTLMLEQGSALRFYEAQKISGFKTGSKVNTFAYTNV